VIGVIGYLADHKGHRFLIEAMPRVLEKLPDARLLIIGDGELRKDLEDRVRFFELGEHVSFTGFVEDLQSIIQVLDIYVQPSVTEGLCTTLFDVMLGSVPILASNTGGIPEALDFGKRGLLVPPCDPGAIAQGIIDLARDPDRARAKAEGGIRWVKENFSSEAMVDRTLKLYERLLET
jgi:glycosyltransferase involved in cell wall biosynthesis